MTATLTHPVTIAQAREVGSAILTEQGFEIGVRGHDVATWSHPDGRVGRLRYEPDFAAGNPDLVVAIAFQGPAVDGLLPMPVELARLV